jgi:hypothetical protein
MEGEAAHEPRLDAGGIGQRHQAQALGQAVVQRAILRFHGAASILATSPLLMTPKPASGGSF